MAKGMYIGVGGVARKAKNMYVGVNGVARKVKKAYIGINGVARLFYSLGPPMITSRLEGPEMCSGVLLANVNDKYILARSNDTTSIRMYDKSLTEVYKANGSVTYNGANSVGEYGILIPNSTRYSISVYDDSLTTTSVSFGTSTSFGISSGTIEVGDYLVFGKRAINSALTLFSDLPVDVKNSYAANRFMHVGVQVGNWGCFSNDWGKIGTVSTSLTAGSTITESSHSLYNTQTAWAAAGSKYAIAVNGEDSDDDSSYPYNNKVWAVDASLTLTEGLTSSDARHGLGSFTLGDYAAFSGGGSSSTTAKTKVDVFDTSLVRTMNNYRTVDSWKVAGCSFGDIGIFYGGIGVVSKDDIDNIDVMTL